MPFSCSNNLQQFPLSFIVKAKLCKMTFLMLFPLSEIPPPRPLTIQLIHVNNHQL